MHGPTCVFWASLTAFLQGVAFGVVAGGQDEPGVAGTSCASPTAAGVFALLNDARLQAGERRGWPARPASCAPGYDT
jgi:hypothetical protein